MASAIDISDVIRGLTLKDLRVQCRHRGLSPAGSQDVLKQRLSEHMRETNDLTVFAEQEADNGGDSQFSKNNFQRPGGNQNIGNRITDRPSSRVLAPPGGISQVSFGEPSHPSSYQSREDDYAPPTAARKSAQAVLHNMGLGNTDAIISGVRDVSLNSASDVAAGKTSYVGERGPTSDRVFNTGPNNAPPPVPRSMSNKGRNGVSSVAFGDHMLPGYAHPDGPPSKNPGEIMHNASIAQADSALKGLPMKDLRSQCRSRGLNPAGGEEALRQRIGEHMISTGGFSLLTDGGAPPAQAGGIPAYPGGGDGGNYATNNYARPNGQQNVGNFITDRSSSRVLAPPGGNSQISFGDYQLPGYGAQTPQKSAAPSPAGGLNPYPGYQASPQQHPGWSAGMASNDVKDGRLANNYARPNGQQNVGNFITDRPSSRVLAPPGGKSQITFG